MPRKPDERIEEAKELFLEGMKLVEIAKQLDLPEGTVRRWKSTYKWDNERSDKNNERSDNKANVRKEDKHVKKKKEKAIAEDVKQVIENPNLTDKQRLFCLHYTRCFNATKAYQKAFEADYATANAHGYELLSNVVILKEIQRLKQNRLNREMLDENDIFQKYMDIAFADITDFLTFGQKEVPVMGPFGPIKVEDPETGGKVEVTKVVNTVSFRGSDEVDGTLISEVRQGKDGASIKLADRMKALEWLSEHMDMATPEQKARMKKLEAETERIRNIGGPAGEDEEVEEIQIYIPHNGRDEI